MGVYAMRVPSELKGRLEEIGDTGFWRDVISVIANTIHELDREMIPPEEFKKIVGIRISSVVVSAKDEQSS